MNAPYRNFFTLMLVLACSLFNPLQAQPKNGQDNAFTSLSAKLIEAVKEGKSTAAMRKELAEVDAARLNQALQTDAQKKAFWINLYNAYIQLILKEDPSLYNDRSAFFSEPRFTIAGKKLSFDDIEHGIIRSSELKLALGLIKNPFADDFEKQFRTVKTDARIHFSLNCGAASCPPIGILKASSVEQQLDELSRKFLQASSTYKKAENSIEISRLFSWFRGDFGGSEGTLNFLRKYKLIGPNENPSISFAEYDWTLKLDYYVQDQ